MLYITRKIGEEIMINNNICITVKEISKNKVKIGFEFPEHVIILRKELYDKISKENQNAIDSVVHDLSLPEISSLVNKALVKEQD